MFKAMGKVLIALLLVTAAAAATADIYRWTDADGVTHFGERPPLESTADRVTVMGVNADPRVVKELDDLKEAVDAARAERQQKKAERRERAEAAKHRRKQCQSAKAHRERLLNATRLYQVNDDGQRERVGEDARRSDLERIDKAIADLCA